MEDKGKEVYDLVVIGSGLGGLACATIFAMEGKSVCVLEKNKQPGGTLQTFVRDKVIFDSGVHYVGALDKGQMLYKLFQYLGIMDKLKIQKMDEDCFDAIAFKGDTKVYRHAQGYDRFIKNLADDFPEEEEGLKKYCEMIRAVCAKFPLYNLRSGDYIEKLSVLEYDTKGVIESFIKNKKLQNILAGTSMLYAGWPDKTPFYVHALVLNSYIESSYKFLQGGSQISRLLCRGITSRGGVVKLYSNVKSLVETDGKMEYAETETGERYYGKTFISNVNPVKTLEMVQSEMIKKAYRNRINTIENSTSCVYVNIVLKKNEVKYINSNYYYFESDDVWSIIDYNANDWPKGVAVFFSPAAHNPEMCEALTLMTYMRYDDVKKWENTFNTVAQEASRGEDYEQFKNQLAETLISLAEKPFPWLRKSMVKYYVATPLAFRDYIGTTDGSLYGFVKDYRDPMRTFLSPRTKIPNLYLTGQNLNLHGVVGVTVSAVTTCSEIFGMDYLLEKINKAST